MKLGYQSIPDAAAAAAAKEAGTSSTSNDTPPPPLELADPSAHPNKPSKSGSRCRAFAFGTIFGAAFALLLVVCIGKGSHFVKLAFQPRHWRPSSSRHHTVRGAHHVVSSTGTNSRWHKLFHPPRLTKVSIGPRPFYLLSQMNDDDPLKQALGQCADRIVEYRTSDFVIGHRGAALQFPEHTFQSHDAASRMGAGLVECDVNLTKDKKLVCRHMRCDLHLTTNVLLVPELAKKCSDPFQPAQHGVNAKAKCCTTDFTLEEIQSLCGKMHSCNMKAKSPKTYVGNTPGWQTDLYSHDCPKIQSHEDYVRTVDSNSGSFVPEFKMLDYDFTKREDGYTREMYVRQILDDYKDIDPLRVYVQGFTWKDMYYVAKYKPQYRQNSFALDKNMATAWYTKQQLRGHFAALVENGIPAVAPAIFMLLEVDKHGNIVPSQYAKVAREMGLEIIAWTLERSDGEHIQYQMQCILISNVFFSRVKHYFYMIPPLTNICRLLF